MTIPALIEIDSDGHRSGVEPGDPLLVDIGRTLHAEKGTALAGVLTHAGASYDCKTVDAIRAMAQTERDGAVACAEALRRSGLPCPVVSVGSTPTAFFAEDLSGVTEVRAGVFLFFDLVMAGLGVCRPQDIAVSVLASIIGHQRRRGWAITDAGWMALSRDRGTASQSVDQGYGLVCDLAGELLPGLVVQATNQEHGIVADRTGTPVDWAALADRQRGPHPAQPRLRHGGDVRSLPRDRRLHRGRRRVAPDQRMVTNKGEGARRRLRAGEPTGG